MACFLGIDYGEKRIGLAVGESRLAVASPLAAIQARSHIAHDVRTILRRASSYEIKAFVIGLPLNMDGTEGEQARLTRRFGDQLARETTLPVHYWDERLSSVTARELVLPAELTRKQRKNRLDCVAAQVILQSFLEAHAGDRTNEERQIGEQGGQG
jgi:putative Holliday junction resolvase